jgi:hypothetical protein
MVIDAGSEADFGIATVPIKLPLINTAVMFLQNGDNFYFDDINDLEKGLVFIDYQLIEGKESSFKQEFDEFVRTVKLFINKYGNFTISVVNKVVYYNNINIICKIVTK